MNRLTVQVLADNTAGGAGLLGEHGLAFWVECDGGRVLFDTGQGLVLRHNAERLGIALSRADAIVLSHGHYDHTGGLLHALAQAPAASLFLHPAATAFRTSRHEDRFRSIGMPPRAGNALNARLSAISWTLSPIEVLPGLFVTGPIPRRCPFEKPAESFFLDEQGRLPDSVEDDQAMWADLPEGVVVLLGCAHAGVINTLDTVHRLSGGKPLLGVVGGMHLGAATEERQERTVRALQDRHIGLLAPAHCTGLAATARLLEAFGGLCTPVRTGMDLTWTA